MPACFAKTFASRRVSLVLLPFFLLGAGHVQAADLPDRKEAPDIPLIAPVAAYSWSGAYVGVNAGAGIDHFGFKTAVGLPGSFTSGSSGITSTGPLAGGQVGYNMMLGDVPLIGAWLTGLPLVGGIAGHIVTGIEVDGDWADIHGSSTIGTGITTTSFATRVEGLGTARTRLGYAFDRLLLYFSAGFSYATVKTSAAVGAPFGYTVASTATRSGFYPHVGAIGFGTEYALTDHLSIKAEYLYDFINARYVMFTPAAGSAVNFGTRTMYHIGRIGLNHFDLFGAPTPVFAKY